MTHSRFAPICAATMLLGASAAALAGDDFDSRFYAAPLATYTLADSERETDDGYGGTLSLGKPLNARLNLELFGTYATADAENGDGSADLTGYGASLLFFPQRTSWPVFGLLSVAHGEVDGHPSTGADRDYDTTLIDLGAGVRLPFGVSPLSFRGQAAYRFDAHSDMQLGAGQRDGFYDVVISAGLEVAFGRRPAPPAKPAPTPPVAVVAPVAPIPAPAPAAPPPPPQPVVLRGVTFDFNSDYLTANARSVLDGIISTLQSYPDRPFEIHGHTDNIGSAEYNDYLSKMRAASVMRYLTNANVAAWRMGVVGFGEREPVASNNTAAGRAQNRRVEILVLP